MSDRREDDIGAVAWPGFVDILSAVIIMFVFFVMITAIVMFVMSVQHKEAMESENEKKVQEEISNLKEQIVIESQSNPQEFALQVQKVTESQNLSEENEKLNEEIQDLSATIKQLKADLAETKDQNAFLSDDQKSLVILYKNNEMSLSPAVETVIKDFINSNASETGIQSKIVLETGDAPNASAVSVMRELALARTLNIRNVMLSENIDPSKVKVTYTGPEKVQDSYHWVKIRIVD